MYDIFFEKIVSKGASEFLFLLSFFAFAIFSSVHVKAGFQNNFQNQRRVSETTVWVIGGYLKAGRSILKKQEETLYLH